MFHILKFITIRDSVKKVATVDTPFCTYEYSEFPVPITILAQSIKRNFEKWAWEEALDKAQTQVKSPKAHNSIRFSLRGVCLSHKGVCLVDTPKSWHASSRHTPLIHDCTTPIKRRMPLWDRHPKSLKFPYQSQMTILESWQWLARISTFRSYHPPHSISYINPTISPLQRDINPPINPRQNCWKITWDIVIKEVFLVQGYFLRFFNQAKECLSQWVNRHHSLVLKSFFFSSQSKLW